MDTDFDFSNINIKTEIKKPFEQIYFGSYPQSLAKDETTISELNKKISNLPNAKNNYNWQSYECYKYGIKLNFMWYLDVMLDDEKYRGVYFIRYRPRCALSSLGMDLEEESDYGLRTVYWFKYEPIKWNKIKQENGNSFLVADIILDSQAFEMSDEISKFEHNNGFGYANNYALSDIRKWLNTSFLSLAFSEEEQKKIIESIVKNDTNSLCKKESDTIQYKCCNTIDKIFLLSYFEAKYYLRNFKYRACGGSDYAICRGLEVDRNTGKASYYLRSPDDLPRYTNFVDAYGNVELAEVFNIISSTIIGILPAMWVKLDK